MKRGHVLLGSIAWGLAVHGVAALLSWHSESLEAAEFASAFAAGSTIALGVFFVVLLSLWPNAASVRWAVTIGSGLGLLSSLAAQLACFAMLRSDAQAALNFVFLPPYVAVATGVVSLIVLGVAPLATRKW